MAVLNVKVFLVKGRKEIGVAISRDGQFGEHAKLDEQRTETLIRALSERRAGLFPTTTDSPGDEVLQIATDPVWELPQNAPGEPLTLDVRHPGLGWLRFQFHRKTAAKLLDDLKRRID
jgi:hypothetical protein